MNEQVPSKELDEETAQQLADRRIVPGTDWTPFPDHFYHGCCDCGLAHKVTVRRVDDHHEMRWEYHDALTKESRERFDHPVWLGLKRRAEELGKLRASHEPPPEQPSATEIIRQMKGRAADSEGGTTIEVLLSDLRSVVTGMLARPSQPPGALRDALDAIASPSDPKDYGWWTQVARRALGVATARETAQPPLSGHAAWQRNRMATWICKNKPALPDHACGECVPGGEIVVEDFQCVYHMALNITQSSGPTKGDSQ